MRAEDLSHESSCWPLRFLIFLHLKKPYLCFAICFVFDPHRENPPCPVTSLLKMVLIAAAFGFPPWGCWATTNGFFRHLELFPRNQLREVIRAYVKVEKDPICWEDLTLCCRFVYGYRVRDWPHNREPEKAFRCRVHLRNKHVGNARGTQESEGYDNDPSPQIASTRFYRLSAQFHHPSISSSQPTESIRICRALAIISWMLFLAFSVS